MNRSCRLHQRAVPAVTKLGHAVHGSPEDADRGERQRGDEALEEPGATHATGRGALVKKHRRLAARSAGAR